MINYEAQQFKYNRILSKKFRIRSNIHTIYLRTLKHFLFHEKSEYL